MLFITSCFYYYHYYCYCSSDVSFRCSLHTPYRACVPLFLSERQLTKLQSVEQRIVYIFTKDHIIKISVTTDLFINQHDFHFL